MLTLRTARGVVMLLALAALPACSGGSPGEPGSTLTSPSVSGSGATSTRSDADLSTATPSAPAGSTAADGRSTATRPPADPADPSAGGTRTVTAPASGTSTLVPWDEPTAPVDRSGRPPSARPGAARLEILLDDGFGVRAYWTLTCTPTGGSHPDPTTACGVLGANGTSAFTATAPGTECDQRYGGPQKALVTGTWKGRAVRSQFTLEDGCEIARWTALIGLLPPGGS